MSVGTILYWIAFVVAVVGWAVWAYVVLIGGGLLGYTRSSTEATPTRKDGQH